MARPRTARDYEDDVTATSRVGLAELMTVLGGYRDALVLIGGWAPFVILERSGAPGAFQADAFQGDAFQTGFAHVGSIDIDFVVDPAIIDADRSVARARWCALRASCPRMPAGSSPTA